jgi:hypothetical protein
MLSYVDLFWFLTVVAVAAVPVAFILRSTKGGEAAAAH